MKNIIDIRTKEKYLKSHIEGAVNISYMDLLLNHKKYLDKDKTYYIYCDSGIRSKRLVNELNSLGYHTIDIEGGYNNYLRRK